MEGPVLTWVLIGSHSSHGLIRLQNTKITEQGIDFHAQSHDSSTALCISMLIALETGNIEIIQREGNFNVFWQV